MALVDGNATQFRFLESDDPVLNFNFSHWYCNKVSINFFNVEPEATWPDLTYILDDRDYGYQASLSDDYPILQVKIFPRHYELVGIHTIDMNFVRPVFQNFTSAFSLEIVDPCLDGDINATFVSNEIVQYTFS